MTVLRIGTRGSDLALAQTELVRNTLHEKQPDIACENITIQTHGDLMPTQPLGEGFPTTGFVGAIERALLENDIDFAVHSYKDLPTAPTPGLTIAATLPREAAHDVLLTREPIQIDSIPSALRIGTSSPRRTAQAQRLGSVQIVPIRGNVPTRIEKLKTGDLDAIILAAAGLRRLNIKHPHTIDLPIERFPPAPGQGALAVQCRSNDEKAMSLLAMINDVDVHRCVCAERTLLAEVGAGCHSPVGAYGYLQANTLTLRGQVFSDEYSYCAEGVETGDDPAAVGTKLAQRLLAELAP